MMISQRASLAARYKLGSVCRGEDCYALTLEPEDGGVDRGCTVYITDDEMRKIAAVGHPSFPKSQGAIDPRDL